MTREEAAADAVYDKCYDYGLMVNMADVESMSVAALSAADAYDAAHGITRIDTSEEAVERAVEAAESRHESWGSWESVVRAVIEALKGGQP